ncbi:hypothetical protein B0O99DRAFT_586780 [Bisporella sp. PMI_857]|nr:hypothetical protein B0O99DRAFT_586780 [Bisporella sp. PMI_857]
MAVALPVDRHVQNEALRIIYAFEVVAAVFIMLRIWSRFLLQKASWSTLMKLRLGLHITDIIALTPTSLDEQVITNKWNISNQLLYNPILGFVKASILLLYLRLVESIKNLRMACYGIMAFNFALMISTFIADLMQCLPVEYNWNSPYMDIAAQKAAGADPLTGMKDGVVVKGGKCFHQTDFYVATAGLSLLTDIMVMAIPIAMVWGLQMKLKKKIIVVGILTLGLAVTAVGLARLPIVHWMFSPKNPDPFYTIGFTTTAMETGLAIATACVPDLAPLGARLFPAYFGSSAYPSNYPSNLSRKGYAAESRGADISKGTVRRNRSMDADSDDAGSGELYMMQGWRGEVTAEVKSDARTVTLATHGSEEAIVPPHAKEKGGITKTTQFVIQNEADEEGKRWSAV